MKVIGIKNVAYNRKSDGQRVEGVEVIYTFERKNVDGVDADKAFIGSRVIDDNGGLVPSLGDDVEFLYNRFGKVSGWTVK